MTPEPLTPLQRAVSQLEQFEHEYALNRNGWLDSLRAAARAEARSEAPGPDALAAAYSQGYRAGMSNEVDDWNADAETIAGYGRHYAERVTWEARS